MEFVKPQLYHPMLFFARLIGIGKPFRLSRSKFESFERLSSGRQQAIMR